MKPFAVYLFKPAAVMVILFILVGCTHIIKSTDLLPEPTGSPLKSVSPKTFVFKEFRDVRGVADPLFFFKAPGNEWRLEQPPATLIATTIKKEFEINGHTCVGDMQQSKSDYIVEGSVYKYGVMDYGPLRLKTIVIATVAVKLTVSSVSGVKRVFTKNYEGKYSLSSAWGVKRIYELLKPALLAMVKEISTDPELIAFIEK
jgi:hypothetical protein